MPEESLDRETQMSVPASTPSRPVCHTIQLCWDNRNPQDQSTSCSIGHPGRDYPETILQPNFGHPNLKQSRAQRVSRDFAVSVYLLRSEGIITLTSDAYHWEQRRHRDCWIRKIYCHLSGLPVVGIDGEFTKGFQRL
jgi:hypothetical protein